ncbi:MAG TPA: ATP phosphoribosyltransferase [Thermoanaerobaculia bacterium]|jgi:ATP phosphoribosyltransferase
MRIAIPKGRLLDPVLRLFAAAQFEVPSERDIRSRKLVFNRRGVEWILVKDSDVPVYVEHGAADAGVAGFDQILEHRCTAYQPVELAFGHCALCIIGGPGAPRLEEQSSPKIATKYPRIARQHLDERGLHAEIVTLAGSVELAAVLSLTSHVIDVVETGETVRVHNLQLQEKICDVTPRLIVGKNAFRTRTKTMRELIARIEEAKHATLQSQLP